MEVEIEFEKAEAKFEEEREELDEIKQAEAKLTEREGSAAKKKR